jgi:hypothetical protein
MGRLDLKQRPTGYEARAARHAEGAGPHTRGNILATSIASDASHPSGKPDDADDLDTGPPIYEGRPRLRPCGLNGPWRFESSRAHRKSPAKGRFLGAAAAPIGDAAYCSDCRQRQIRTGTQRRSFQGSLAESSWVIPRASHAVSCGGPPPYLTIVKPSLTGVDSCAAAFLAVMTSV